MIGLIEVLVRYEDGESLPHYKIRVGNDEYETDDFGRVVVNDIEAGSKIKVVDTKNADNSVEVDVQRGDNQVELILEREKPKMIRIRLMDEDGNPIRNQQLKIYRKKRKETIEVTSDADGCVFFNADKFDDGEKLKILLTTQKKRMKLKLLKPKKE